MKICIDARKINDFGIGTYIQNLLTGLAKIRSHEYYAIASPDEAPMLNAAFGESVKTIKSTAGKYSLSELLTLSSLAEKSKCDLYHAPHYTLPYGLKMKSVVTVHDVIHLRFPQYYSSLHRFYAQKMIAHACSASAAVIVDSQFTKDELLHFFRMDPEKIFVIHLGVADSFSQKITDKQKKLFREKYSLPSEFILYTGSLMKHKNVGGLLKAMAFLPPEIGLPLVISGGSLMKEKDLRAIIAKEGLHGRIIDVGKLSPGELPALYQCSSLVVLPSLYEGFGFSVLEAMASGVPAIGSRVASIPEVMGEGSVLFNPHKIDEMADAIRRVLEDTALRQELVAHGAANVKKYSWKKTVYETLGIYSKAMMS